MAPFIMIKKNILQIVQKNYILQNCTKMAQILVHKTIQSQYDVSEGMYPVLFCHVIIELHKTHLLIFCQSTILPHFLKYIDIFILFIFILFWNTWMISKRLFMDGNPEGILALRLPWVWIRNFGPRELGHWVWPESQFGTAPSKENWDPESKMNWVPRGWKSGPCMLEGGGGV